MTLQTELNIQFDNIKTAQTKIANKLIEEYGKEEAESKAYNFPDSMKNMESDIAEAFNDLIDLHLLKNFREIVNQNESSYRSGDLWILGDAYEIEKEISENVYHEIERLAE